MELHDLTQSVILFLREPLADSPLEIVGVVEDIPLPGANDDVVGFAPTMYVPRSLASPRFAHLLIRTALPPRAAARDVRRALASVDPGLIAGTGVLQDSIERYWIAWPRLIAIVAGSFAAVGIVLVVVGVFGVLSYSITQLKREIGIRLTLGASPTRIARDVLGRALRWVMFGLILGVIPTVTMWRIAGTRVWGLEVLDMSLLTGVAGLVLLVGVVAAWFPARRAMRVDPMLVLRAE